MITRFDIEKIWTDNNYIYATTKSGRSAKYAFTDCPRLANAPKELRESYTLSHFGIHWEQLDEDLSFEGMINQEQNK